MTTVAEEKDAYRRSFDRFFESAPTEPEWLRTRRVSAFGRFVDKGLPTPRDEAWRQTPIAPITGRSWAPAPAVEGVSDSVRALVPSGIDGPRIVLVGGRVSTELSSAEIPGAEVRTLGEVLASEPTRLEPRLEWAQGEGASVHHSL